MGCKIEDNEDLSRRLNRSALTGSMIMFPLAMLSLPFASRLARADTAKRAMEDAVSNPTTSILLSSRSNHPKFITA